MDVRPRLLAGLALVLVAALSVCRIYEHDTPWYLASGELILGAHALPAVDPFSYTSTRAWLNHEWLSEVVLALVHWCGGLAALSILQGVVVAATLAALAWRCRHPLRGGTPLVLALVAFFVREAASPRAQLFSSLLFAVTLTLVLADEEEGRRRLRLWWCVPLQLLWTQLHGGNPTGVALLGLLFLSGPSLRRALVGTACALATIVGPYGPAVHAHFLGAHAALPMIREWEPLWHALVAGAVPQWIAVALLVAAWLAVVLRARSGDVVRRELLLLLVFSVVAVRYVRFSTEASLVAGALLAAALDPREPPRALRIAGPWLAAAALAALIATSPRALGLGLEPSRFPEATVRWLREHHPAGPMLNSYNFGGYLLWAWPEQRVFVDGRAFTVYDEVVVAALPAIYAQPDRYAAYEARYGFRLAVLQRTGKSEALIALLRARSDWRLAHEDEVAVVFVRD